MRLINPSLVGQEATRAFLSTLRPNENSKELWVKLGHSVFYKTDLDFEVGQLTYLQNKDDPTSRIIKSTHTDFLTYLEELSKTKDGGVFYISSQPQEFPIKECVESSDDLVFELDSGTLEEQLNRINRFLDITGLQLSSLFTSGGKSFHGHLKLSFFTPIDRVIYLNQLIATALRSDPVVARPHQPTRIPGFFRKEKDKYQALYYISHTRYEYDDLLDRIKKFFDADLLEFPPEIPDDWWSDCIWKILKLKNVTDEKRDLKLRKNLIHGVDGWRAWKKANEIIRKQKQDVYESRKAGVTNIHGETIVDLVRRTCEDLEDKPFQNPKHNWEWSNGDTHARGRCLWHESGSGNSAWLDARGGWSYHCPVCTNDKPLDALSYWQLSEYGEAQKDKAGLAWVKDAKTWLELNNVEVPELNLGSIIDNICKFPEAPELEIDEEKLIQSGGWEHELERAVRVYILQDRMSSKIRLGKYIRDTFGVNQGELDKVAVDVNIFNYQEPELVGNLLIGTLDKINQAKSGNSEPIIKSALYGLNRCLPKGYARGLKVVLAALSSTGKTAIAIKEAYSIAAQTGEAVAFFSAESPTEQIIYRLLSQLTHIPLVKLFTGNITDEEYDNLLDAAVELSTVKLYIDGTPGISTSQIRRKLMRLNDELGSIRAIFVDHLSKLVKPHPGNVNASMEAISHELSNIANDLNATGFWLCQFNRGHAARQTKEPVVDDIRDSDAIVQDADTILMPFRPGSRDDKTDPEMMKLFVRKNRDGPLGYSTLRFLGEVVDIEDGENHSFSHINDDDEEIELDDDSDRIEF